jgi:hypothetical protein
LNQFLVSLQWFLGVVIYHALDPGARATYLTLYESGFLSDCAVVAANQEWMCGNCNVRLDHTFEIDHKIRLEYGGDNDVSNLIALCRNCHGKKTALENM